MCFDRVRRCRSDPLHLYFLSFLLAYFGSGSPRQFGGRGRRFVSPLSPFLTFAECLVNAANEELEHISGVAGAVRVAGGPDLVAESNEWVRDNGPVAPGQVLYSHPICLSPPQVAWTTGGKMMAKICVHAVGPIWDGGSNGEPQQLASTVLNALLVAHNKSLSSIAIPAISSGIFGFPKLRCAQVLFRVVQHFCERYPKSPLRVIRLTNLDAATVQVFVEQFDAQFGALAPNTQLQNEEEEEEEEEVKSQPKRIFGVDESSSSGSSDEARAMVPEEMSDLDQDEAAPKLVGEEEGKEEEGEEEEEGKEDEEEEEEE